MFALLMAQAVAQTGSEVVTEVAAEVTETMVNEMSLWEMALKGGWIMGVLALLSIVCFYIFFERLMALHKAGKNDPLFMECTAFFVSSSIMLPQPSRMNMTSQLSSCV